MTAANRTRARIGIEVLNEERVTNEGKVGKEGLSKHYLSPLASNDCQGVSKGVGKEKKRGRV